MTIFKKLTALENEASDFGFAWETAEQISSQIQSELSEIKAHFKDQDKTKLQEEIGDLLHAAFSLCIFCELDAEKTLENSVAKFERRFHSVKQLAAQDDLHSLKGKDFKELMLYWGQAKKLVG
ncbi:MAG: MazG nucleotide pyrophosphohydrolase domain-containing protein [Gammaproteobacteria bacterium]